MERRGGSRASSSTAGERFGMPGPTQGSFPWVSWESRFLCLGRHRGHSPSAQPRRRTRRSGPAGRDYIIGHPRGCEFVRRRAPGGVRAPAAAGPNPAAFPPTYVSPYTFPPNPWFRSKKPVEKKGPAPRRNL